MTKGASLERLAVGTVWEEPTGDTCFFTGAPGRGKDWSSKLSPGLAEPS